MGYLTTTLRALLIALGLVAALPARADQTLQIYHVLTVFAESGTSAGFFPKEPLPQCLYGIMYIDLSSPAGKANMALVTSAKSMGWAITRMDYTKLPNGTCSLVSLHVT